MIKDSIKNANYYNLSEHFKLGLDYLKNTDFSNVKNGKYEILGNEVFAIVQDYTSKEEKEGKFEVHRKYIDIQFIVEGEEKIGVGKLEDFQEITEYDEKKDIVFLNKKTNYSTDFIKLREKEFAIFLPTDAHMPSLAIQTPSYVKKVVVKVLV